jgi:hypothetical protein
MTELTPDLVWPVVRRQLEFAVTPPMGDQAAVGVG